MSSHSKHRIPAALLAALVLLLGQLASAQSRDEFSYWDLSGNGDLTCAEARDGRSGDQGLKLPAYRDDRDGTGIIYEWLERSRSSDSNNDGVACESISNPGGYIPNVQPVEPEGCPADAETWRGLQVCEEQPRDDYDRSAFGSGYSSLEDDIIDLLPPTMKASGQVYTPYSCLAFDIKPDGTADTDIEHIVALAEAHDSRIADDQRRDIASDLDNLTIAAAAVNRSKSAGDAAEWTPARHGAWFAERIIAVKLEYGLSVDPAERDALEVLLTSGGAQLSCVSADTTPPTVTISSDANAPVTGPFRVTIAFSEPVTGFDLAALVVGNGSASELQGTNASYTATVTPAASGTVTVDIAAGAAQDSAGNPSTAADQFSITADTAAPTVTISSDASAPITGPFSITVTFSEPVTGFELADLVVVNGGASGLQGDNASYTATVTPAASGTVTVNIAAGAAQDSAGNLSDAADQFSINANLTQSRAEFSYWDVDGDGDLTCSEAENGRDEGLRLPAYQDNRDGTRLIYEWLERTRSSDTDNDGIACESSSNPNGYVPRAADTTPPTVTITSDASEPVSGPFPVTIAFSEPVTGFDLADLVVGNGSASELQRSEATYMATVTPTASGTVTVDIAAGAAEDSAGNPSSAADQFSITADTTAPTVTIASDASEPVSGPFPVTVTFSEPVTGFELADLVVGNGSASELQGSEATYTATVTPTASGAVTVDIAAGAAEDGAGNPSAAADQFSITADLTPEDTTAPTVTTTSEASEPVSGPFSITVTFSEPVTGFELADLVVGNGSASELQGSEATYTATVTPTASGAVTVDIAAGAAEDGAGNPSAAADQFSITADLTPEDTTAPTVTTTSEASEPVSGPFSITVTFSEPVTGFELADLVVGNGSASELQGSEATYTATVTPTASGAVTVDIAAGAAEDGAGNPSAAADQFSITADLTSEDTTAPTVTTTSEASEPVSGPFSITVTFSEPVTGFELADLVVGNGSASELQGSEATYTATVTPTASGAVTVDIAAGAAEDGAGNPSAAADQFSITADLTSEDTTAPTVTTTSEASEPVSGPFSVTVTFSEPVTGFELADLVVGNGSASELQGSEATYTATVTPTASGAVTVDIAAGAAEDGAGNPSAAADQFSITADLTPEDTTAPTVTTTSEASEPVSGPFSVTVTFSEPVTGFELADLIVGNGSASELQGSEATYTADGHPYRLRPPSTDNIGRAGCRGGCATSQSERKASPTSSGPSLQTRRRH